MLKKAINIQKAITAYIAYEDARRYRDIAIKCYSESVAEKAKAKATEEANAYHTIATELLSGAIKDAEGRSTERVITPEMLVEAVIDLERNLGIPKKAMEGIEISVDINAQSFPSAYKYTPMSTHFRAVFKSKQWRVTYIGRDACRRPSSEVIVTHTEERKNALIKRFTYIGR